MTMRDHLLRRGRHAMAYRMACLVVLLGLTLVFKHFGLSRLVGLPALLFLIVLLIPMGRYFVRCTQCRFPFEFLGRVQLRRSVKKHRLNYCPHCGASLD